MGGQNFLQNLSSVSMDSRWVIFGSMGGLKIKEANLVKLLLTRSSIRFSTLRSRSDEYKADLIRQMMNFCKSKFESEEIRPIIDRQYNLSEVNEAH